MHGATQFFIDPVKIVFLVESMGVTKNDEENKDDRGLLIDRVIDNSLLRKACAICGEQPDKLFPDKNEEYYICKECKLREGK